MVCDIIDNSWATRGDDSIDKPAISMSSQVLEASNILREFLFERVYNLRSIEQEAEKAKEVIRLLYNYFNENEDKLPQEYRLYSDDTERKVVDYIAGMTDQYALKLAEELDKEKLDKDRVSGVK